MPPCCPKSLCCPLQTSTVFEKKKVAFLQMDCGSSSSDCQHCIKVERKFFVEEGNLLLPGEDYAWSS
jgi:hypothetical protein